MKKIIICYLLIILPSLANAKWASFDEAPMKVEFSNIDINVKSDGTFNTITEIQEEILKEQGRDHASSYRLYYNGDSEELKILEAKTIIAGESYKVDQIHIVDKAIATNMQGFDENRQVLIAFPKVQIGAKIYIKYSLNVKKNILDKHYEDLLRFGDREYIESTKIKLHSAIPLHMKINDPDQVLNVTTDSKDKFHNMTVTLNKPMFKSVINEPNYSIIDDKYLTWISISSTNEWSNLSKIIYHRSWNKVLAQELPSDFKTILDAARNYADEISQINFVTSSLSDKIQYMGDWRSIDGGYTPRSLDIIAKTQMGDCKDFSASTGSILNALEYRVEFALVSRGVGNYYPEALPSIDSFNHVLLKVTSPAHKIYWIDPTNLASMADGIFPDIGGKNVLVLGEDSAYEKIPEVNPDHAKTILKRNIDVLNQNEVNDSGELFFQGEEALELTGAMMHYSPSSIKDNLFYDLSKTTLSDKNKKMNLPDLNSRNVKDLNIDYSYNQKNSLYSTNLGVAYPLSYSRINFIVESSDENVSDIFLIYPHSFERETIIENVKVKKVDSLNKEINNKWIHISRTCSYDNNKLRIKDKIIIFNKIIKVEDFNNPEFIDMKNELEKNFKNIVIILN